MIMVEPEYAHIAQVCTLLYKIVTWKRRHRTARSLNEVTEMGHALTVKQIAELLAVNERTVYRMANSGELPGFQVSGSWRFMEADIHAWIEDQKKRARDTTNNDEETA